MLAKVFLLALFVAIGSASPVTEYKGMISYREALDAFLDAWKKMLPCGYAADNIPVLAPLVKGFQSFEYNNGETNLVGNFSNFRVSGLNNFEILSGSFDDNTLQATFDVLFPEIQILGSYEVEGVLSIGGFPMPIRQSVVINKKISDWRFVGDYTFGKSQSNYYGLRIIDFNLRYFVADVKADNWDKFLDIATNNFLNDFIGSFSMLATEEVQPYVKPMFDKYVLPTINDLLSNMNMNQLINYFVMQAQIWNNAGCNVQA